MTDQIVERVTELRAENMPGLDLDTLLQHVDMDGSPLTTLTPDERATLDAYLRQFVAPQRDCISCGRTLVFIWGIVHGQGNCASCGWPARAYHSVPHPDASRERPLLRLDAILQVHPDTVALAGE